jgi:hypothetical protein
MTTLNLRIFRSFRAKYYENDILNGPAAYPEEYFAQLVENGFNAVWLRGILRNLARTDALPDLGGDDVARHQDALGTVIERAARHGVKVLLYLNEPLCLDGGDAFWKAHPDLRGVSHATGSWCMDGGETVAALCTSTPEVRAWLREAARRTFEALPGLGGWFAITASEHLTNCHSHGSKLTAEAPPSGCPRCAGRPPLDIVAEILADLHAGTREASSKAYTIAWNWSWEMYAPQPQPALLQRLPRDMVLLLDWERGGTRRLADGRENFVDEYSLAYVGPSERFMVGCQEARKHGLGVMAKLQVGTTHELATVPNLPLVDNLYAKLKAAEELGLQGLLATWNFGNSFSLNTAAVRRFVRVPARPESPREFVEALAVEYFPGADAAGVAAAVERFSAAMLHYPFDMMMLYSGPANYALAYPLTLEPLSGKPMGPSWMVSERGDDLEPSLRAFKLDDMIGLLGLLVSAWEDGVRLLERALAGCRAPSARTELGVARMVGLCYRSTRNVYRTYKLRLVLSGDTRRGRRAPGEASKAVGTANGAGGPPPVADGVGREFRAIVADEIAVLETALPLMGADPRLGFHAECQAYLFDAERVRAKLAQLRAGLREAS